VKTGTVICLHHRKYDSIGVLNEPGVITTVKGEYRTPTEWFSKEFGAIMSHPWDYLYAGTMNLSHLRANVLDHYDKMGQRVKPHIRGRRKPTKKQQQQKHPPE
jgi:hypothetical protein